MSQKQMLSRIWCLASWDQFVHLYHLFFMQSDAIFHFYCSLYLFILRALIEFNWFDPSRSSVARFTGVAAIWEALPPTAAYEIPKWAKLWYRTVLNIIDTGIFPVPVYRAYLVCTFKKEHKCCPRQVHSKWNWCCVIEWMNSVKALDKSIDWLQSQQVQALINSRWND